MGLPRFARGSSFILPPSSLLFLFIPPPSALIPRFDGIIYKGATRLKPSAIAAIAVLTAASAHAQMYKCVDERGTTHYTDKPGPECKGDKVDIRAAPPLSGRIDGRTEDLAGAERDFRQRQIDQALQDKDAARKLEAQKRRCASMHAEYRRLTSGVRLARINEKGERVYVEDAERDRRAAQLKTDIARNCP
jgi:hypothetical protein